MKYQPDHYVNYHELKSQLEQFEQDFPDLCKLESIGKTKEDRDILLLTLTHKKRDHSEKPAYWVDGNTHATELAGCQSCLHTIDYLTKNYGKDSRATFLLDNVTFYIVPRISPDGVEHILNTGEYVRSSNIPYPRVDHVEGLIRKDINRDGQILYMRIKDSAGRWKVSKKDDRLLIPREIDEYDEHETYYRLLSEGEFENFDGFQEKIGQKYDIDFNRQFPAEWMPEGSQKGAGDFPLSEPETRAVADAINARKNIFGLQSFHTFSGVILRPFMNKPDTDMDDHDLHYYKEMGEVGENKTGYPAVSVNHEFRYHPKRSTGGGFIAWTYEHLGIFSFTNEIWNIGHQVGIEFNKDFIRTLMKGYSEDEWVKILSWCDKNLKPKDFFEPWTEFDHPQLGKVEIGGLKTLKLVSNPPDHLLEKEVHKNMDFVLSCAMTTPLVEIKKVDVQSIGDDLKRITIDVKNSGHLPSYGSNLAVKNKAVPGPKVSFSLNGLELVQGSLEQIGADLYGRSASALMKTQVFGGFDVNHNEKRYEWIVSGKGEAFFEANFFRGGVVKKKIVIE